MLEIKKNNQDDVVVLGLKGQLDALTAAELRPVLEDLLTAHVRGIVFDLGELDLIDSSGIGAIVAAFKRTRANGGDTKIANLGNQPLEVFKILNLDKAIDVFDSLKAALGSLR